MALAQIADQSTLFASDCGSGESAQKKSYDDFHDIRIEIMMETIKF